MKNPSFRTCLKIALFCAVSFSSFGQKAPDEATRRMISNMGAAVKSFVSTLDEKSNSKGVYPFSSEVRFEWYYTPHERKGIALKDMSEKQKQATTAILKNVLSESGLLKAEQIIDLEYVLRVVENRPPNDFYRDPGNYLLVVFGTVGDNPWGWRMEGHHLSVQMTVANGQISFTPGFMGSNPGKVLADVPQKGRVILKEEQDLAFQLLKSLNETQKSQCLLSEKAPNEIFTANNRKAILQKKEGISYAALTDQQKDVFKNLVLSYLNRYHVTLKNQAWAKLEKSGLDNIYFAWMGDQEPVIGPGHGHYYRIHAPTMIIEFDNTQNDGNHIHSVVRDLENDFGDDLLGAHYQKEH